MIGSSELLVILILALFLFGPQKLPELARSLGKAVAEYKKAAEEVEKEIKKAEKEFTDELEIQELVKIAKNLNIPTSGKSKAQLLKEIAKKTGK
ncbi:MAG: twin-arginine translocase TatA/TatE family subunit [Thermoplasmata archaeon]|nr:MAG: twin-arginine translocase TatA/TatE family subunit [Thermoplasmata archaeon]